MTRASKQIPLVDALAALHSARTNEVVVTAMGTAREWMRLSDHPLDFVLVPSSMGQAPALGLGIALARPDQRVIVCNGDGSTLMNLGSLVTISGLPAENLVLLIFDNRVYEVTGAQQTPGSAGARCDRRDVEFAAIARGCGFRSVFEFNTLEGWQAEIYQVLNARGPTVAVLDVAPVPGAVGPKSPGPAKERASQFAKALSSNDVAAPQPSP